MHHWSNWRLHSLYCKKNSIHLVYYHIEAEGGLLLLLTWVRALTRGEVRAECCTAAYHSRNLPKKGFKPLSVWANVIEGTVCVSCQLCGSPFALSPLSLAATALPAKSLRSKIDLKVEHKRFPKGRREINYDRWLSGLVLFWGGVGVRSDKQAIWMKTGGGAQIRRTIILKAVI